MCVFFCLFACFFVFFTWIARWFIKFEDQIRVFSIIEGYIQDSVFFIVILNVHLGNIHTTPEKFGNGVQVFILKHSQGQSNCFFFPHYAGEICGKRNNHRPGHFGVVLEENAEREIK